MPNGDTCGCLERRRAGIPGDAKLVINNTRSASRLWLARRMTASLAHALPGRHIHLVADSAYAGGELKKRPVPARLPGHHYLLVRDRRP